MIECYKQIVSRKRTHETDIADFLFKQLIMLKTLSVHGCSISNKGVELIVAVLAKTTSLANFDMSKANWTCRNNLLKFTSIVKVAEGLRGHQKLQNLNLSNNLTTFLSEAEFLVDVILSTNQSLVYLNVCGRNIRPRFTDDHLSPPSSTEMTTNYRFPLQTLYLSRLPLFDVLTCKNEIMDVPDKFIEAKEEEESCLIPNHDICFLLC